eukprot:GEMP01099704.1.p1 GENE.GEMP01099704.1~~GEMP01099704.1.p1  ORF type:complete len:100 (-),score=1.75 GEMP01099704.1:293-592(-)
MNTQELRGGICFMGYLTSLYKQKKTKNARLFALKTNKYFIFNVMQTNKKYDATFFAFTREKRMRLYQNARASQYKQKIRRNAEYVIIRSTQEPQSLKLY